MFPEKGVSTHPGEILSEDFLKPTNTSQAAFARHIGVEPAVISEIVHGKRGVSPEMAMKFSAAFGTSAEFWCNLQTMYDFTSMRERLRKTKKLPVIQILDVFAKQESAAVEWN